MADDEDEDLYGDEFDFVDEDDDLEDEADDVDVVKKGARSDRDDREVDADTEIDRDDDRVDDRPEDAERDDIAPVAPAANYVVHVYEYQKFKRTIDRPFTPEDAESFASEYNRTAKSYGRFALAGKDDVKPKKSLD